MFTGAPVCLRDMRGLVESIRKCGRSVSWGSFGAEALESGYLQFFPFLEASEHKWRTDKQATGARCLYSSKDGGSAIFTHNALDVGCWDAVQVSAWDLEEPRVFHVRLICLSTEKSSLGSSHF